MASYRECCSRYLHDDANWAKVMWIGILSTGIQSGQFGKQRL